MYASYTNNTPNERLNFPLSKDIIQVRSSARPPKILILNIFFHFYFFNQDFSLGIFFLTFETLQISDKHSNLPQCLRMQGKVSIVIGDT